MKPHLFHTSFTVLANVLTVTNTICFIFCQVGWLFGAGRGAGLVVWFGFFWGRGGGRSGGGFYKKISLFVLLN